MKTKLGLGLVTAAMLAFAGSANAVVSQDYTGLAFSRTNQNFLFTSMANSFNAFPFAPIMTQPTTAAGNLGQFVYTLSSPGTIGSLATWGGYGATMDFSTGSAFSVGGHTVQVMDGLLNVVGDYPGDNGFPFYLDPGNPTVNLPTIDSVNLGTVAPQYWLTGSLQISIDGGAAMNFEVCELYNSGGFGSDGYCTDRTFDQSEALAGTRISEPFNTLATGAGPNEDDLAFFLLLRAEVPCDDFNVFRGAGFGGCGQDDPCTDVTWLKLAGWGTTPSDAPEPATLSLFGLGLVGLGAAARRRRKAA